MLIADSLRKGQQFSSLKLHFLAVGNVSLLFTIAYAHDGVSDAQHARTEFRWSSYYSREPATQELLDLAGGNFEHIRSELLPVEEDTDGNWGTATNGIVMSARFYRTNYAAGDPITAVIILRNAGQVDASYPVLPYLNYPFELHLLRDGTPCDVIKPRYDTNLLAKQEVSVSSARLTPGVQMREALRLDNIFDLSKLGLYEFYASAEADAYLQECRGKVRVTSGIARFRISPD